MPYVIISLAGSQPTKPTKPIVSISAVDADAAEDGQAAGEFMIALDAPTSIDTRVAFKITGTAKKNRDYHSFPASLLIPAGNVSGIIEVLPVDDAKKEKMETVILKLKAGKGYKVGSFTKATIQVLDND